MQITLAAKRQAALEALRVWHNAAIQYPENYTLTFTQFVDWIDKAAGGTWRENFGASVIDAQEYLGFQAVINAMENLAHTSKGRVTQFPDGYFKGSEFFEALIGKLTTFNWDRIKAVGSGVASDVFDAAGSASKWFLGGTITYFVVAGLIGVAIFAYSSGKNVKVS